MKLSIALGTILSSQTLPLISEAKKRRSAWSSSLPHDKQQQWNVEDKKTVLDQDDDDDDDHQDEGASTIPSFSVTTKTHHHHRNGGRHRRPSHQQTRLLGRIPHERSNSWSQQRMRMRKKLRLLEESSYELVNDSKSIGSSKTRRSTFCDPSSSDPDVGVLSCGEGKKCLPCKTSKLGGRCMKGRMEDDSDSTSRIPPDGKNLPGKGVDERNSVECISTSSSPSSKDIIEDEADVGVLVMVGSCGMDEICIENTDSALGGFCSSSGSQMTTTSVPTTTTTDRGLFFSWYV